jgi:hypothetical protein
MGISMKGVLVEAHNAIATVWDNDMNMIIYVRMMKIEGYRSYIYIGDGG